MFKNIGDDKNIWLQQFLVENKILELETQAKSFLCQ